MRFDIDYSQIKPETVAWATQNARQLLADENDRVRSIDGKSSQLAGFAGVILAVLGAVAPDALREDLGGVGDPVFAVMYFTAAVSLTIAIVWLVFFVLRPQRFVAIDAEEIGAYLEDERLLRSEPWGLQMRTLRALRRAAIWAQKAGQQKADRLTIGIVIFGIGLGAALAAVVTLGAGSL